jgi:O-antigen ligase
MFPSKKIEVLHLWGIKFTVFLIPLVPLYISPSMLFPYITGKNFAFRILVEFAAALWLGLIAVSKEYRLRNSIMALSVLFFTFIVGLADLFGVNPYNSLWSNYERMEGYITILHLALFFMIIKSIFKTKKDWMIFFGIYLTVSMFVSLFAFIEPFSIKQTSDYIVEYGTRRSSTIGNPPFLASYLLFSVFIGLILIHITQKTYLKLFFLLPVILNSIVIYLTASRGAILAAFIGAIIIGVSLLFKKLRNSDEFRFNKVLPYIFGLLIILSIIVLAYQNAGLMKDDGTISRFMMMSLDDPSIKTRLYAWRMVWNGFKENPVLGWGQENFFGLYTVNPIPLVGMYVWVDRAHNIVLDWLINAGALGLFSYLSILGSAFYILRDNLRKEIISRNRAIIIVTAIIVYFIQNLFTFDTINSYIVFFALLAYIDNIETIKKASFNNLEDNIVSKKSKIVSAIVTLFALLVIASISYVINYIPVKQLQLFTHINRSLSKYNSFSTMLDDFNKALTYRSFGDNYIREGMQSVSSQIIDHQFYNKEGALKLIQRTVEELEKGLATNRHNLNYILNAVYFFRLLAIYEPSYISAAETLIEESMRINPQYQRLERAKVDVLIIKKDFERAFDSMKRIAELEPGNASAQHKLALTAILTSREKVINEALEKVKKIRIARNKRISAGKEPLFSVKQLYQLAQAYIEVKNYNKALQYYREIITILPDDKKIRSFKVKDKLTIQAGYHLEMAKIYIILADNENAIKEAEKAAELDPVNFADEVKKFID